jgi:hypothetical protein
LSSGTGDEIH